MVRIDIVDKFFLSANNLVHNIQLRRASAAPRGFCTAAEVGHGGFRVWNWIETSLERSQVA
jgi:hypothetical protein